MVCPVEALPLVDPQVLARFRSTRQCEVSRFEPRRRSEFVAWGRLWPLLFRPTDLDRERETGPSAALEDRARRLMTRALEDSAAVRSRAPQLSGAVLVNPDSDLAVMTCAAALEILLPRLGEHVLLHPLYSPTMLVIAALAAASRGECSPLSELPEGQYLCTGLERILHREPDLAASMALVHSRIACVVYQEPDAGSGGLGSRYKLHTLRSINHRFRVYRLSAEDETSVTD